ncbi:hypothetical protein SELMODRAFT_423066 [Selaginella moellendorffii]|uniref:Uncharacterized protein n=1 Tax=Selaginella moellendorffii TaxID=88036 RepID=D8SKG5_SELML|nr:hypothetical protein SELMODRAFT_423066 [Selaginella moellendorffii]
MKQVRERLYISNADDAGIYLCGIMQGFTHVLSLAPVCLHPQCKPPVRKIIPLLDKEDQDILPVLQECLEFIDEGMEQGMVLVHCVGGRSRSASVVIAYLMWKEGCSFDEALESLLACRKCVRPNDGFITQLQEFESTLRGEGELGSRKSTTLQAIQSWSRAFRILFFTMFEKHLSSLGGYTLQHVTTAAKLKMVVDES